MAFEKITDGDLEGKGNVGRPDTPGVDTAEMQRILDELSREVIVPAFNKLIDDLQTTTSASYLGASVPEGLPEGTENNVQKVSQAIFDALNNHKKDAENPHKVTAKQTGAYTKEETQSAINEKVQEIGAGDMAKSVYDTKNKKTDIFDYADNSRFQFPIGYIFDWAPVAGQSADLSTPEKVAQHFGYGTWQEITGRFTFGRDASHEVGSTGGEENHVLTLNEVPQDHTTLYDYYNRMPVYGTGDKQSVLSRDNPSGGAGPFYGGGQAHNNMPPYLTVYKWQRIA